MGAQVLGVDRRLDPVLAEHVRGDVDQEGGVRRERTLHRPPQVHVNGNYYASERDSSVRARRLYICALPRARVLSAFFVFVCVETRIETPRNPFSYTRFCSVG